MSNPQPARPAVKPEVGLGLKSQAEVTSNDEPRSRTVVESNDAVEGARQVEVEKEEFELNGTVITTYVGVQPDIQFAPISAEGAADEEPAE